MSYVLVIWTIVGYAGVTYTNHGTTSSQSWQVQRDWRPIAEFRMEDGKANKRTALEMCDAAASDLNISRDKYRCVRTQ